MASRKGQSKQKNITFPHTIHDRYIKSHDDTRIHYWYKKGARPCIVFIHGLSGGYSAWPFQTEYFSRLGHSILTLDLRGHGYSQKSLQTNQYTIDHAAQDIAAVLKQEQIQQTIIVSHCMGSFVAMRYAALYPQTVAKLILISFHHKPKKDLFWKFGSLLFLVELYLLNLFWKNQENKLPAYHSLIGMKDFDFIGYLPLIKTTSPRTMIHFTRNLFRLDAESLIPKLTMPTLIIQGKNDFFVHYKIPLQLHKKLPHATVKLYHGVGHNPVLNNPDQLNTDIKDFLENKFSEQ